LFAKSTNYYPDENNVVDGSTELFSLVDVLAHRRAPCSDAESRCYIDFFPTATAATAAGILSSTVAMIAVRSIVLCIAVLACAAPAAGSPEPAADGSSWISQQSLDSSPGKSLIVCKYSRVERTAFWRCEPEQSGSFPTGVATSCFLEVD